MEGEPIEVVLVEDNDTFRQALELMLGLTPDVRVVAAVADGESALEVCPGLQPDVVLVDYRLPGLDGVETTAALRAALPKTAVVETSNCATSMTLPRWGRPRPTHSRRGSCSCAAGRRRNACGRR